MVANRQLHVVLGDPVRAGSLDRAHFRDRGTGVPLTRSEHVTIFPSGPTMRRSLPWDSRSARGVWLID